MSSSEDDENDEIEVENLPKKSNNTNVGRISVSAEVYGTFNKKTAYVPKVVPKNEGQIERIRARLSQAFMFSSLDEKEKKIVIDAMEEVTFKAGEHVIKQGEDGDVLYVVDSGKLDCFKKFKPTEVDIFLTTYEPGAAFGELALLYNAPRAASIVCKEDSILFSLDRECFNSIVKDAAVRKREKYNDFLKKVELLESCDPYEISKICDCLTAEKFNKGETIITQGDVGNTFYFIEEGKAQAYKKNDAGNEDMVFQYKENDYFGELALIYDAPRAATIKAETDIKLVTIDRLAFNRLLGNLTEILKRNASRYEAKMKELGLEVK